MRGHATRSWVSLGGRKHHRAWEAVGGLLVDTFHRIEMDIAKCTVTLLHSTHLPRSLTLRLHSTPAVEPSNPLLDSLLPPLDGRRESLFRIPFLSFPIPGRGGWGGGGGQVVCMACPSPPLAASCPQWHLGSREMNPGIANNKHGGDTVGVPKLSSFGLLGSRKEGA